MVGNAAQWPPRVVKRTVQPLFTQGAGMLGHLILSTIETASMLAKN